MKETNHTVGGSVLRNKRALSVMLFLAISLTRIPETAHAFSLSSQRTTTQRTTTQSTRRFATSTATPKTSIPVDTYNEYDLYYSDNTLDDTIDDSIPSSVLESVQELQQSSRTDVLDTATQKSIRKGTYWQDTTPLEQVAMASIPQQLPRAAQSQFSMMPDKTTKAIRVTPEEEIALARTIQRGVALHQIRDNAASAKAWAAAAGISPKELRRQVTAYRQAKHTLVAANVGLVHAVVKQMQLPRDRDEMIQEGMLGLLRAAELFDPDRGLKFSTYAVVWIKGVLRNSHATELVRLPAREKNKWHKILQAQRDILASATSEGVSLEELSVATGLSPTEIQNTQRRMTQAQYMASLDAPVTHQSRSGDDTTNSNTVNNHGDDSESLVWEQTALQADVLAALARNLNDRERRLIRLRYGFGGHPPRTLQECAEAMGLSYTRVHGIMQQCLEKLRNAAEAESLEEYFMTIA